MAGLTQVFLDAGVLKPSGSLTEAIVQEWSTEAKRLAQDRVTQADKATIVNAIRTYAELNHFMTVRDRTMPRGIRHQILPGQWHGRACQSPQLPEVVVEARPTSLAAGKGIRTTPLRAHGLVFDSMRPGRHPTSEWC